MKRVNVSKLKEVKKLKILLNFVLNIVGTKVRQLFNMNMEVQTRNVTVVMQLIID